jgi:predicted TIM-barrel fold metal-dependent hydrolase
VTPPPDSEERQPIVDSHHHLWDTVDNPYPWLEPAPPDAPVGVMGDLTGLPRPWLIDDYLAHARPLGIVKSVHVEALWGGDPVDEVRWVQGIADEHGFPHGIVGRADLAAADVGETLDRELEAPNLRGIRQCVNWDDEDPGRRFCEAPALMLDAGWRRGFAELASRNLSFDLFCNPAQLLPEAVDLARSFPDTRIVLEHTGAPFDRDESGMAAWRAGMAAMAAEPNVVLKLSGMGMSDHRWTVETIRPFILEGIELFGAERCMFATNSPADLLYSSFEAIVDAFLEIVGGCSPAERAALLGETATRVYRL